MTSQRLPRVENLITSLKSTSAAAGGGADAVSPAGSFDAIAVDLNGPFSRPLTPRSPLGHRAAAARRPLGHHWFQWMISEIGRRGAGLKSVPTVYAMGNSPPCVYVSYGMPRISAASRSWGSRTLVRAEPRPRVRNARNRLQTAGYNEPHSTACVATGALSTRPRW